MPNNYQVKWVQVLPKIGTNCPVCQKGWIVGNDFTSKVGELFKSVKCDDCRTKWLISKFPPKTAGKTGGTEKILKELDQGEIITGKLNKLHDILVIMDEKLNKLLRHSIGEE